MKHSLGYSKMQQLLLPGLRRVFFCPCYCISCSFAPPYLLHLFICFSPSERVINTSAAGCNCLQEAGGDWGTQIRRGINITQHSKASYFSVLCFRLFGFPSRTWLTFVLSDVVGMTIKIFQSSTTWATFYYLQLSSAALERNYFIFIFNSSVWNTCISLISRHECLFLFSIQFGWI